MITILGRSLIAATIATLAACATAPSAPPSGGVETVSWSVGPCFGFCPVYTVEIEPNGSVAFDGDRNTAALGRHVRPVTPAARQTAVIALAPFRPTTGTAAQTTCDQRISDQSTTKLVWRAPDGTVTSLTHDKGCRSARNAELESALRALPATLGIEEWTQQTTRPGASRG